MRHDRTQLASVRIRDPEDDSRRVKHACGSAEKRRQRVCVDNLCQIRTEGRNFLEVNR